MTTSGTYTWNLQRDDLILLAFQLINVYGAIDTAYNSGSGTVSSADNTLANNILNGMLKMWSVDQIKCPKRKQMFVFPALSQTSVKLGSISGSDNATNSYVSTTLTTNASSSATSLTVSSTSGMTIGDYIGITLNSGARFWTTIATIPSGTSLTINSGITSAASSGNYIVSYTTKINRPLDLIYATRFDITSNIDNTIAVIGHDEYFKLPGKSISGAINNIFYDKEITGARPSYSNLFIYPTPDNVDHNILRIIYTDQLQDMSVNTDDLDLPQEWLYPAAFCLAVELAPIYGKFQELQFLDPKAKMLYQLVSNATYDSEPISFKIKRHK